MLAKILLFVSVVMAKEVSLNGCLYKDACSVSVLEDKMFGSSKILTLPKNKTENSGMELYSSTYGSEGVSLRLIECDIKNGIKLLIESENDWNVKSYNFNNAKEKEGIKCISMKFNTKKEDVTYNYSF